MSARRLDRGGSDIDRSRPLEFAFDGQKVDGFHGDTIASALLASNIRIVARSFKHHRPRGVWGAGVEEPNALVDVADLGRLTPNVRATVAPARPGLVARSVNASPTARADRYAFLDRFARFIPAGFYYKTFLWPNWRSYENRIRAMAGLGRVDPASVAGGRADQINAHCDLLVVGAGPAGLAAALQAGSAGASTILVDDGARPGGSLRHRAGVIDGAAAIDWAEAAVAELKRQGVEYLPSTTAFGVYDHNLVGLAQRRGEARPDTLWRVRARHVIVAAGAIERPLPFANNDLPGIMSADAALIYLRRYGVIVGERIVVATNNDSAYEVADALAEAGAAVTVIDSRANGRAGKLASDVRFGRRLTSARGRQVVEGAMLNDGATIAADCILVSGGWTPTVHLFCQARGKLAWRDELAAFAPAGPTSLLSVAGAAAGAISLADTLASGAKAAREFCGGAAPIPVSAGRENTLRIDPIWSSAERTDRVWIDYQSDVTAKDVELAARENFVSVEHLKRYTTLGMATDQGKTSNIGGLALMAEITGRQIAEVGTTTYRPPYAPTSFASLAGLRGGALMSPLKRLPLEAAHRARGAVFREYGGWLRPAYYGGGPGEPQIQEEARQARRSAAIFDASTLGKIEVVGPQAAEFFDFIYYNAMSTLRPGRCRYGLMLSESGIVFDDGVLARLGEDRFLVSCSSSHVGAVHARLEEWRQDRFDRKRLFIHNATSHLATVTVSGPRAKALLSELALRIDLDDSALPHMAVCDGDFQGGEMRVARVSFTGDRSYEISVPADRAEDLWMQLIELGKRFEAAVIGVEALMILRAEKGYIGIGKDTDGATMPHDLGMAGPRERRLDEYVGRRSLFTEEATRADRRQLVGLSVSAGEPPLATGAHGVEAVGSKQRSIGYVTSSYMSPTLGFPIALGLIERGASRRGEAVDIRHLGEMRRATIGAPCAFDLGGTRLNA